METEAPFAWMPAESPLTALGKLAINASQVEITAGQLTIRAGISNFSGVVQANTVIATTIVPGGGNIW